jgi:hypothetical protein
MDIQLVDIFEERLGIPLQTVVFQDRMPVQIREWCRTFNDRATARDSDLHAVPRSSPLYLNPDPEHMVNILLGVSPEMVARAVANAREIKRE